MEQDWDRIASTGNISTLATAVLALRNEVEGLRGDIREHIRSRLLTIGFIGLAAVIVIGGLAGLGWWNAQQNCRNIRDVTSVIDLVLSDAVEHASPDVPLRRIEIYKDAINRVNSHRCS